MRLLLTFFAILAVVVTLILWTRGRAADPAPSLDQRAASVARPSVVPVAPQPQSIDVGPVAVAVAVEKVAGSKQRDTMTVPAVASKGRVRGMGLSNIAAPAGVYNGVELYRHDREAKREIQAALTADAPDVATYECLVGLAARTLDSFSAQWTVTVEVEARDGHGRVISVRDGPSGNGWPALFDAEAKDCVSDALRSVTFEASHDYSYSLLFPMCARGAE